MILEMDYVTETCKLGQGAECCRYLVAGSKGFECAKLTMNSTVIDRRVANGTFTAQGDNCDGKPMHGE